jgi:hypothetical protein
VLRTRFFPVLGVLLIGGYGLAGAAGAQHPDRRDSLSDVVLPCGVRAALAAMGDRSTPDRGHFILEITRRLHAAPGAVDILADRSKTAQPSGLAAPSTAALPMPLADRSKTAQPGGPAAPSAPAPAMPQRADPLPALIAHLDRCSAAAGPRAGEHGETLPLPLPVSMWLDTVFGGRVGPERLAAAILESRNASLLYTGLLSLDEATRDWIASRPDLIAALATRHAAAFTLIAPGLRATNAGVQVPGGQLAEPVWEALVGRSTKAPAEFVRALLAADERRLPYMFGALAQLSPAQAHLALHLDAPDPAARISSARRLHAIYIRLAHGWRVESRAFWRPTYDPALLAADLRHDDEGRPVLPGTRRFWAAVFAESEQLDDDPRALAEIVESDPVEFAWLCERIFEGEPRSYQRRYHQVLFGSRILAGVSKDQVRAAVEAVRAQHRYPALVAALERAGVVDVTVIAAAARRAAQLSKIRDTDDAVRAAAQFQGLLTLLQRAALRDSISLSTFADLVTTLVAVDLTDDDTYEGRLVRWLDQQILADRSSTAQPSGLAAPSTAALPMPSSGGRQRAADDEDFEAQPVERALLDLVAGRSTAAPQPRRAGEGDAPGATRIVEWEGTRYRVDLATAEAARLERLRGEQPRPYVSAARALIGMADTLRAPNLSRDTLSREARLFVRVENAVGWSDGHDWSDGQQSFGADTPDRARDVAAALQRAAQRADRAGAARLAPAILVLAEALLARGLTELVYATAQGRPERAGFSAEEAAARHDFGARLNGVRKALGPWEHPVLTSSGTERDSRVTGSLLGLDVALAPFSLVRLSSKLPPVKPTLNENDRRALVESVVLVRELGDADRDQIVDAMRKGRDRLAAVATPDQAMTIADEIGMGAARHNLLVWSVTRAPDRVPAFLSPSELLWLGLGPARIDARLHAWGAPARARLGCLCLQLFEPRPLEPFTGRWGSGIFATAFPDLNLRLAELLAELRMPASLVGPVLTSATLELVNNTASRDPDDRRALVEFVAALTLDRLEQYLALLTTDGPLVPIGKAPETSVSTGNTGVPW